MAESGAKTAILVTERVEQLDQQLNHFCRYVFTGKLQRLRWPLTAKFPSGPLRSYNLKQIEKLVENRLS